MDKKKKGYLNNTFFLSLLKQYEELSDDTSTWFRSHREPIQASFDDVDQYIKAHTKWNNSVSFLERKEYILSKRQDRIKNESKQDKLIREKKLKYIKNEIGKCFIALATNILKKPNFINYDYYRKSTMISDACYFMYMYIERFDTSLKNPFSYFTQITNSAFLQNINKCNKNMDSFVSLTYIDNMNSEHFEFE